jgi:hypothetical protein
MHQVSRQLGQDNKGMHTACNTAHKEAEQAHMVYKVHTQTTNTLPLHLLLRAADVFAAAAHIKGGIQFNGWIQVRMQV